LRRKQDAIYTKIFIFVLEKSFDKKGNIFAIKNILRYLETKMKKNIFLRA